MSGRRREDARRGDAASAAFAVECPGCRAHVAVARGLVGRVAGCPLCRTAFLVPVPGPEERGPPGPLVFSEPPVPSTRRLRDGLPTAAPTEAADPMPNATSPAATTPAVVADGLDGLPLQDPVKVVRSGGVEIELRRLTPAERQARRARRNLIILVVGSALLVALVVLLRKGAR